MARYIKESELLETIDKLQKSLSPRLDARDNIVFDVLEIVNSLIEKQPTANVVEAVRCKDCIHFTKKEENMFGIDHCHILYYIDGSHREVCKYDYCSYGKKVE